MPSCLWPSLPQHRDAPAPSLKLSFTAGTRDAPGHTGDHLSLSQLTQQMVGCDPRKSASLSWAAPWPRAALPAHARGNFSSFSSHTRLVDWWGLPAAPLASPASLKPSSICIAKRQTKTSPALF